MPQEILRSILYSPASASRVNDVVPDGLTLSSIDIDRPQLQDVTSSRMLVIVWSSVAAAIGILLVAVGGFCLANYSR